MRIYLAARYSRREELCEYRRQLQSLGYEVQARWLDGKHQIADNGIPIADDGEALVESDGSSIQAAELRAKFAQDDWEDVTNVELVINFAEAPRSSSSRGGRHVEFGIALAMRKTVWVIGHRENIFHYLPEVIFFGTWSEALTNLTAYAVAIKNLRLK